MNDNLAKNKSYKHGMSKTPTHISWTSMLQRVRGTTSLRLSKTYKGMYVDPRWFDFRNFFADMGERPTGTSLDRIDGKLGYFKANCRWSTRREQNANRAPIHFIEMDGEKICLTHAAEKKKFKYRTLLARYHRGDRTIERLFRLVINRNGRGN